MVPKYLISVEIEKGKNFISRAFPNTDIESAVCGLFNHMEENTRFLDTKSTVVECNLQLV